MRMGNWIWRQIHLAYCSYCGKTGGHESWCVVK